MTKKEVKVKISIRVPKALDAEIRSAEDKGYGNYSALACYLMVVGAKRLKEEGRL
jgi:hypothetical protein